MEASIGECMIMGPCSLLNGVKPLHSSSKRCVFAAVLKACRSRTYSACRASSMPSAVTKSTQISEYAQRQLGEEVVDFQAGQPGPALLPLDLVAAGAAHRFTGPTADPYILQYGPEQGYQSFRRCLATFLTQSTQHQVDPEELLITAGVSHGLDLACRQLARAGDVVLVEQPTYFLAGGILRQAGLQLVSVPMCDVGLDVDALEQLLQQLWPTRPRLLYTIPIHNNPTGTTLPLHKRQQLLRLAHRYNFTVLADEVYQLLSFPDSPPPPPPLKAVESSMLQQGLLDTDGSIDDGTHSCNGSFSSNPANDAAAAAHGSSSNSSSVGLAGQQVENLGARSKVVSLGSFSKIMAPGMRLGWIEAAPHLLARIRNDGVLGSGGSIAPLASGIAHSCLELGLLQQHLHDTIRPSLQRNCAALCEALRQELPQCAFQQPLGGYFVWVVLPEKVCAEELLKLAGPKHNVRFLPGSKCEAAQKHMMRLSFAFYQPEELQEGVRRLAAALADYMAGARHED